MQPGQPPPEDPYRAVWQMSQVGGPAKRKRLAGLRLGAGLIAGLVAFAPFGVVTAAIWGWWSGESHVNGGGWAVMIIGLAAGFAAGGFVASEGPDN